MNILGGPQSQNSDHNFVQS